MRRKKEAVLAYEWNNNDLPLIVRSSREKHKEISRILDKTPGILNRVHQDLEQLSERDGKNKQGRKGDFTSETILRAIVILAMSGDSLLWDTYRVAAWQMRVGREICPASCSYRFHESKVKKLYLHITRYSNSKNKKRLRKVKRHTER